jgi:hypothetical protein
MIIPNSEVKYQFTGIGNYDCLETLIMVVVHEQ